jgi:hypothetical protein
MIIRSGLFPVSQFATTNTKNTAHHQHTMPSSQEVSLPLIRVAAPSSTIKSDETKRAGGSVCGNIISLALPLVLFLQFGLAFQVHDKSTDNLEQPIVNFSIALFTVTSLMYRKSLADVQVNSVVVNSVPDATAMGVIALICNHHLTVGFLAMLYGMLLMALSVVANSIYLLRFTSEKVDASPSSAESLEVDIV